MGAFTQAIRVAKNDFSKRLYFKEDIERQIIKLRECINNKMTDTEHTVRSKILRMFAANGIELDRKLTPEQYNEQLQLHDIQSVKKFPEMCWEEMMKVNLAYKTPKEYMQRLVGELGSSEYNLPDSTVRVKILKQILGKLDCLKGTSFESEKLNNIIDNDYDGMISNIGDEIFDNYLIPIQPCKYLKALLDVYGDILYRDGEKDDDLQTLVMTYDNSVKGKTAKQLLQFIRTNNPEVKKDDKGKEVDVYNIADFDKSLAEQIKNYLDGARITFKEKYEKDFDKIKLQILQMHVKQFDIVMQFVCEHDMHEQLKTKRFVGLIKSHMGIDVQEEDVNTDIINTVTSYSMSAESKEKFNNYLIKQIAKYFNKADVDLKKECDSFLAALNEAEYECDKTRYEAIVQFIKKRGLEKQLLTGEDNSAENPVALKKVISLLIEKIENFKKETNKAFDKAVDNAKDNAAIPKILKIANDLAEGKYKSGSEMKERLYLFAFAFDMSVNFEDSDEKTARDIKKNLFEDFYCDNIIRYINDHQLNGVYDEPTGITIQFKNFVEIVYLYWLNKDSKICSQAEKYRFANAMIKQIVAKVKSAEKYVKKSGASTGKKYFEAKILAEKKALGTEVYRNFVITDNYNNANKYLKVDGFLDLPEEEFLNVIFENYDVDTMLKYTTSAAFENENYQESAEADFEKLIDDIKKETDGFDFVSACYSLEFYQTVFEELFLKKEYDATVHSKLAALVKKINEQMKTVLNEAEDEDYNTYTRTRYMYLYYNHFILSHIGDKYTETFDDFCDEYCENLNKKLEDCSYQLFSEKNLIDIMLLYSAFITLRTDDN